MRYLSLLLLVACSAAPPEPTPILIPITQKAPALVKEPLAKPAAIVQPPTVILVDTTPRLVTKSTDNYPRVAMQGDSFYFLEQSGIRRVSKDGKDEKTLRGKIGPQRCALLVHDDYLYWTKISGWSEQPTGGFIHRIPLGKGKEEVVTKNMWFPESLAWQDDRLYSLDWANGNITQHNKAGDEILGNAGTGLSHLSMCSDRMVADKDALYYSYREKDATESPIMRLKFSEKEPTLIAKQPNSAMEFALDGTHLYWSIGQEIYRMKREGGEAQHIASGKGYSTSTLLLRGDYLYWLDYWFDSWGTLPYSQNYTGPHYRLMRVLREGGTPEIVYQANKIVSNVLLGDDNEIFWLEIQPPSQGCDALMHYQLEPCKESLSQFLALPVPR